MVKKTSFVKTKPKEFTKQADFLNGAAIISTTKSYVEVKRVLKAIEKQLKRKRTKNKAGPRKIDLDIVIWNKTVKDKHLLKWKFLKRLVKELLLSYSKNFTEKPVWAKSL